MSVRRTWSLIKTSVAAWSDDYAPSMGAAISYYTLFSIAPLLVIVIAIAGLVFGADAAQNEIVAQLRGLIGQEGAIAVQGLLKSASGFGAAGSLVVLLIWVYYSAQIFLLGAEFTWAYAHAGGSRRVKASGDALGVRGTRPDYAGSPPPRADRLGHSRPVSGTGD